MNPPVVSDSVSGFMAISTHRPASTSIGRRHARAPQQMTITSDERGARDGDA